MAVLLWSDGDSQGALGFENGQIIGRDCFEGSPEWMPGRLFTIRQLNDVWLVYKHDRYEWLEVGMKPYKGDWGSVDTLPNLIGDDTLITIDFKMHNYRFIFHSCGTVEDYTLNPAMWDSEIWRGFPAVPHPFGFGKLATLAIALEWLAVFFRRHRWYAVAAVITLGALLLGPNIAKTVNGLLYHNQIPLIKSK